MSAVWGVGSWLPWRAPRLRFADEAEEARFVAAGQLPRLRHFMSSGLVALVAFNLFLLSDWMMVPDRFEQALRLRLLVFTPVALFFLVVCWRWQPLLLRLPAVFIESIAMLAGVAAALCLVSVLLVTDSPYAGMYRCGLLPILVYGTLVQRFRFGFALVFSISMLVLHLVTVFFSTGRPSPFPELEVPMLLVLLVVMFYTLIMNYRMELEERRRFQQKERAAELRERLQASQSRLKTLSRQDALTGVPNRRRFDEVAALQWQRHQQTGEQLAVLLIDVDHFKAFNDRHGHPAGDQCLRLVAQALQGSLAPTDAILARWGGEEFIALLPHTDDVVARRVGERLCDAVRGLALRHGGSPVRGTVTISVGVALARPVMAREDLSSLVAQADAALYQAKREGRDRSVLAAA